MCILLPLAIGRRNNFTDPTPGDLVACVSFVQRTLPIALARPFVEQFVPEGTRVGMPKYHTYYNYYNNIVGWGEGGWANVQVVHQFVWDSELIRSSIMAI